MTDEEECVLLKALIDGTAEDAEQALIERRGSGITQQELRALEERGVVEVVHERPPEAADEPLTERDDDELETLRILGLTPAGLEYAEGCETDPAR